MKQLKTIILLLSLNLVPLFSISQEKTDSIIYETTEDEADFQGGYSALMKFIEDNKIYPQVDIDNSVQGKVHVLFVIEADGKISNIKIQRGVSPTIDKEAMRIISIMPDWIPGKLNGKKVAQYFSMPITFKL